MIQNLDKKHKTWVTWEERAASHPAPYDDRGKVESFCLRAEKSTLERNRRHKALTYFETKGALLMRKAEVVAASTEHETYLPARQVALDDDVYYIVKQTHERLGHVRL
jgi:hypothetical protein